VDGREGDALAHPQEYTCCKEGGGAQPCRLGGEEGEEGPEGHACGKDALAAILVSQLATQDLVWGSALIRRDPAYNTEVRQTIRRTHHTKGQIQRHTT